MNKDLEIKKLCNAIRNYAECELDYGTLKTLKMIEDSASRMAAEFERLENKLREYSCQIKNFQFELEKVHYEKDKEIDRLKAEIERLKKIIHLCDYCQKEYPTCDAPKDIDFGRSRGNDNVVRCAAFADGRNLWAEIACLKAEIEKRPEVVRCGECKKKDLGFTCPLVCANAVIKAKTKTENFIVFDDNDFCSAGQRRESEEGK